MIAWYGKLNQLSILIQKRDQSPRRRGEHVYLIFTICFYIYIANNFFPCWTERELCWKKKSHMKTCHWSALLFISQRFPGDNPQKIANHIIHATQRLQNSFPIFFSTKVALFIMFIQFILIKKKGTHPFPKKRSMNFICIDYVHVYLCVSRDRSRDIRGYRLLRL